jgi:hypothetical protein
MTRTKINMKRFISHGTETFLPYQSYTVDTDLAEIFVQLDYATIVEQTTQEQNTFNNPVELESKVEKAKRKRKGDE